jgi:tetratricopeptide (TPR) repeat protein
LRVKQLVFRADHVDTADAIYNLGVTSKSLWDYNQALDLFNGALVVYRKHCPQDSIRMANALKNIANTYSEQGGYDTAIKYFHQVPEIETREFGLEDVNTANTLSNIGAAYGRIDEFDEAVTRFPAALRTTEHFRGPWHLDVTSIHHNLGMTHLSRGNLKIAKLHLGRSRRIFLTALGKKDFKSS